MNKLQALSLSALAAAGALSGCDNNNSNGSSSTTTTPTSAATSIPAGSLLVSRTNYTGTASTVIVGQALPGGGNAIADGGFPEVFENETPDASFGVSSPIFLDIVNPANGSATVTIAIDPTQMASSFSSKSELALNESLDGTAVTFMGYKAPVNTLDVSNSNTDEAYDQTNPVASIYQRAIGQVSLSSGALSVIPVNAYSGNNGRAVVLANGYYYMTGNAGNGSASTAGLCLLSQNTGVQFYQAGVSDGGDTFPVGALVPAAATAGCEAKGYQFGFAVSQAMYNGKAQADDKTGKDDNYRGLTMFNNTLYVTKGSGSNGVNTVYQVGNAGGFANGGVVSDAAITILPGFNTLSEKTAEGTPAIPTPHPFGIWFANATTLFVADEGDGTLEGASGKVTSFAGLQQWSYSSTASTWTLVATYQGGLNINTSTSTATVTNPSPAKGAPSSWHVYTDGLRNLTGRSNSDGSVTLYATTSTTSDDGTHDLGADPNQVVSISIPASQLALTAPASGAPAQTFTVVEQATAGQRLGGVLITH
ncbi:MAG: hypothetical protein P4L83_05950 [Nevskia sp.]|nr:hypothetical protein [Nevskia sp.]